jgi:hypothetical protein
MVVECLLQENLRGFGLEGGDVGVFKYSSEVNVWVVG